MEALRKRLSRVSVSRSVPPSWEDAALAAFHPLTMRITWRGDSQSLGARLEMTVRSDRDGVVHLSLQGGYVDNGRGGQTSPSDAIIAAPSTGAVSRAICELHANDRWSWNLQRMRGGGAPSELECSVCMHTFKNPVRFPARRDASCDHVFCRGCVSLCLPASPACPLCRAPAAEGMTAAETKRLPIDEAVAAAVAADVAFRSAAVTVNYVDRSHTVAWKADPDSGAATLPDAISVVRKSGRIRAWRGAAPKKLSAAAESEQVRLLGFVDCAAKSEEWPSQRTCVREVALGVEPNLVRSASGADLAVFLSILTEEFWARGGHSNQPMFTKQLTSDRAADPMYSFTTG